MTWDMSGAIISLLLLALLLLAAAVVMGRWIARHVAGARWTIAAMLAGVLLVSVWMLAASPLFVMTVGMGDGPFVSGSFPHHQGMMGWMHGGGARGDESELTDPGGAVEAEIHVDMRNFAFEPDGLVLNRDAPVRLTVVNHDSVFHDLTVNGLPIATPDGRELSGLYIPVAAGQTVSVVFTPLAAGSYEIICAVPGHVAAGMIGNLQV